jgi:magnesium-protoporphyrin IX monomethyl ester (oxidative) cyclase
LKKQNVIFAAPVAAWGNKMKILLIRPPYSADTRSLAKLADFPLGLAYICAVLEKEGHRVAALDALIEGFDLESWQGRHLIRYGLPDDELKKRIRDFSPDIVGVSCLFSTQADNAHNVCKIVKEISKSILTVMGGSHPSVMPDETLRDENVDFVVIGEGEYTMRDLLKRLESKDDFLSLDGLAFRKDGKITVNPKTKFIEALDDLPFPARHYFPMEKYFDPKKYQVSPRLTPAATLISSRGCPAKCIFCSIHKVWGRPFRARSAENVLNEIGLLVDKYGVKEIQFADDNMTLDKKRLMAICNGIKERFPRLKWLSLGVALWALDEEMITSMAESGCYRIYLPVESGDQDVLTRIVKKPLLLSKIPPLLEKMRSLGMEVHGFFVIGFPGETPEQVRQTLRYARELNLDHHYIYYATPYPGTEMYETCKQGGFIIEKSGYKSLYPRQIHIETPALPAAILRRIVRRHNIINQWTLFQQHPIMEFPVIVSKLWRDFKSYFERIRAPAGSDNGS